MALEGTSQTASFTNLQIEVPNDLQVEEGELPEDEKMEEDELEEGEASEDEVEVNVIIREEADAGAKGGSPSRPKEAAKLSWQEKKYENKSGGGFVSGIYEVSNKVLTERARRFGVTDAPVSAPTPEAISKLYKSLDVIEKDFTHGHYRADALHVRGTENLNTQQVFDYFQAYAPSSLEWINDNSCNVVWLDAAGPVRALIGLSCPIIPHQSDVSKKRRNSSRKNNKKKSDGSSGRREDRVGRGPPKLKIKKEKIKIKKKKKKNKDDSSSSSSSTSSEDSSSSSSSDSSSESDRESKSNGDSSSSASSSSSSDSSSSSSDSGSSGNEASGEKEKRQLKKKTKTKVKVKTEKMDDDVTPPTKVTEIEEGSVKAEDVPIPVPPGRWRLGVPCPHTKALLMRFSSRKDRKQEGAEKNSEYYRKYGNPNYGGIKGLLSESGRRRMREAQRRRDLEERYDRRRQEVVEGPKNPWGALALNWGRKESQEDDRFDYQELLRQHQKRGGVWKQKPEGNKIYEYTPGTKRKRMVSDDEEEYMEEEERDLDDGRNKSYGSDDSDDVVPWKSKIKIPRMKMYADAEQKKMKRQKTGDLWSRLSGNRNTIGGVRDRLSNVRTKGQDVRSRLDLRSKLMNKKKDYPTTYEMDDDRYYSIIASDDE